ncbi:MAG: L-2-amino-thiazoline-4-carboxylic acid hydrolase, partial [Candidatus Hodarchaeota archaeon]
MTQQKQLEKEWTIMQIMYRNYFDENGTISFDLLQHLKLNLSKFDVFLMNVKEKFPKKIDKYLVTFENELDRAIKIQSDIEIEGEYPILGTYPGLLQKCKNALLSYMNYENYKSQRLKEKITIKVKDFIRSDGWAVGGFFSYTAVNSLKSIMDREEALTFWKKFFDEWISSRKNSEIEVETLDEHFKNANQLFKEIRTHNYIEIKISDGKAGDKVIKCLWPEVMRELEDKEICDAICCYYDYQNAKNENSNFVLTRTKTLMMGNNYCDFMYHDTRLVDQVEHPDEK